MFPLYFEFNELGPGADLVGWGGGGGGGPGVVDWLATPFHSHTTIPIDRRQICVRFMALHPIRRMNASSLFVDN